MSQFFLSLLVVVLLSLSMAASASPIADLQQRLNSFKTMTANFVQTLYTGKKTPSQTTRGNMALERPGKFVWITQYPNQQKLVANGKVAWVYDIDLEQATKTIVDNTNANSPAVFLTGDVGSIPNRFKVSEDGQTFILSAKSNEDMFQKFTLHFNGNELTRMDVLTKLDQTSKFEFSKIVLNKKLPNGLFVFKPPKGVDILENR